MTTTLTRPPVAEQAREFLKRAGNYKNLFRQDKGHVWPKDAAGNWIEPYTPGFSGGQGGRGGPSGQGGPGGPGRSGPHPTGTPTSTATK